MKVRAEESGLAEGAAVLDDGVERWSCVFGDFEGESGLRSWSLGPEEGGGEEEEDCCAH
jgi:hypothetical protein